MKQRLRYPIRILAGGFLACAQLLSVEQEGSPVVYSEDIKPVYFEALSFPVSARLSHTEGSVIVRVNLGPDGEVLSSSAISGPKALIQDCLANSRKWRFRPNSQKAVVIVYQFRFTGVCAGPCPSQFLFYPPNVATITVGEPVVQP